MNTKMTDEQQRIMRQLHNEGYAVVVWTADELKGADPEHVQDRLIELGWDVIDTLQGDNE